MSDIQTQSIYNLPYGYGDNRITLFTRDPHCLYVYWEVSDTTKNSFIGEFGSELWDKSVPVLKVTNVSKNINSYIRINDFSNSWYINVDNPGDLYTVELGRRVSDRFFINLLSSNYVTTPNDVVSSNTAAYFINYKDLKNGVFNPDDGKIYETYNMKLNSQTITGPSSPELLGISFEESSLGISSAELFKAHVREHLGISSDSFMNWK